MILLNYIYFLIITFLGGKFLTSKQTTLKNPLNKEQTMLLDGPEMFWILTFSTGLLALSAPGGIDLMAIRLLVLELFCIFGLFICKHKPIWTIATVGYVLYILWLFIGLSYSSVPSFGFRVILKYLYPFLVMLFASAAVRHREVFITAGLGARNVAILSILISFIPFVGFLFPGVFWYGTARAINYISMCMFSLALFFYTDEKKKNLWLVVLFALPCILWVFRTSIMGTTLALMVFAFFKYKMKSLPVIFSILLLAVIAVFTIPAVKEKMFKSDNVTVEQLVNGELSQDDIESNARFAMWEHLQNRFYEGHELVGSGIGSVQNYMYNNFVFGGLQVPHNDYIQISCDSGIVGVVLYLLIVFSVIAHSFVVFQRSEDGAVKICAIVAGSSMAGLALTMYTDNVVNYSMATLSYPFGFYGMMLGLNKKVNTI